MANAKINLTYPKTKAINGKAHSIFNQSHSKQSSILTAEDKTTFPFLNLPIELEAEIVSYVWQYSNLKTLCLVSKHVSDVATPYLYYEVDLIRTNRCSIKKKISILLINPTNLHFVRVLKTPSLTLEESLLMDQLLPHLRKDYLKEINFASFSVDRFPMPQHIEYLWYHQKKLQNLELKPHMIPWLERFSKKLKPNQSNILKFFSNLEISTTHSEWDEPFTQIKLHWPLQNLELSVLQKLTFSAQRFDYSIFYTLNILFAKGCFVNLTELGFRNICNFDWDLKLTKLPSLKCLVVNCCTTEGPRLPLVLADDIRLSSLTYRHKSDVDVEKFIPLLAQAIGVKYLSITRELKIFATTHTQRALVDEVIEHKDTLRELHLNGILALKKNSEEEARLWDTLIVERIQAHCKNLVNLSIPLVSKKPVSYYCTMVKHFPHLASLKIYESAFYDHYIIRSKKAALELFSASTSLKEIYVKKTIDEEGWRFVRKDSAKL